MTVLADLHMHTYYSDGAASPSELVLLAKSAGIGIIAVSDHDTIAGVGEAMTAAAEQGIRCLPSVELSAYGNCETHILGYNMDTASSAFMRGIAEVSALRAERIERIVAKLQSGGYNITLDEVRAGARASIGRQNIAAALVRKGYFRDVREAYSLMTEGAPFFVAHSCLLPEDAIRIVKDSGGQAVLAHPGRLRMQVCEHAGFVEKLKNAGLDGIESRYRTHTNGITKHWNALADRFGLYSTVGGDNHTCAPERFFPGVLSEKSRLSLGL